MKKFYTLILACLLTAATIAQTKKPGVKYSLKGGVNFATFSYTGKDAPKENDKALLSFQMGAMADIPISTSFSIQPGLSLSGKGSKQDISETVNGDSYYVKAEANIMYLELPINAVYKVNNFYFGAGPYVAYAISGKLKSEATITVNGQTSSNKSDTDIIFGNDPAKDQLKRGDYGINLVAGYQLPKGIVLGVNYGLGLSNISLDQPGEDAQTKNRVFSATVGFSF